METNDKVDAIAVFIKYFRRKSSSEQSIATTQMYTHVAPEQLRRLPDLLPGFRKVG